MAKSRSEYEIGLKDDTGRGVKSIERNLDEVKKAFGEIAKVAGFAIGIDKLVELGAAAVEVGSQLHDMSIATGASVEQLSFLKYAAEQTGSSSEGISRAFQKLSQNLYDIANGGGKDAAKALNDLNLNAKDLASSSLYEQFSKVGDALLKIENPSQRAALAQKVFGKGVRELLPFLLEGSDGLDKMLSRFEEIAGHTTTEAASKLDDVGDSFDTMKTAVNDLATDITTQLSPALTGLFTAIANESPKASNAFHDFIANGIYGFVDLKKKLLEGSAAFKEWLAGDGQRSSALRAGAAADRKDAQEAQKLLDQIYADEKERNANRESDRKERESKIKKDKGPIGDIEGTDAAAIKAKEVLAEKEGAYIAQLVKRNNLEAESTELAKVYADIASGALKGFSDGVVKTAIALADMSDAKRENLEVDKYLNEELEKRNKLEAENTRQMAEKRGKVLDDLQTPLEKYVKTIQEYQSMDLPNDKFQLGIIKARNELEAAQAKTSDLSDAARDLGLTFSSAFEEAVINGQKLRDVVQGLIKDIAQMILRKSVTEPLANLFAGTKGSGTTAAVPGLFETGINWFKGLFHNDKGGLYKVGGSSSEHLVGFTARSGETVSVGTGGVHGGGGGDVYVINNTGAAASQRRTTGPDGRRRMEITIGDLNAGNVQAGRATSLGMLPPLSPR